MQFIEADAVYDLSLSRTHTHIRALCFRKLASSSNRARADILGKAEVINIQMIIATAKQEKIIETDLPHADDCVCNQNQQNDERFDECRHLLLRFFEPGEHLSRDNEITKTINYPRSLLIR